MEGVDWNPTFDKNFLLYVMFWMKEKRVDTVEPFSKGIWRRKKDAFI